jgi:hypothetical protein
MVSPRLPPCVQMAGHMKFASSEQLSRSNLLAPRTRRRRRHQSSALHRLRLVPERSLRPSVLKHMSFLFLFYFITFPFAIPPRALPASQSHGLPAAGREAGGLRAGEDPEEEYGKGKGEERGVEGIGLVYLRSCFASFHAVPGFLKRSFLPVLPKGPSGFVRAPAMPPSFLVQERVVSWSMTFLMSSRSMRPRKIGEVVLSFLVQRTNQCKILLMQVPEQGGRGLTLLTRYLPPNLHSLITRILPALTRSRLRRADTSLFAFPAP